MAHPGAEIAQELENFYREYIARFNRESPERFLECFTRPYVTISGERGMQVIKNDDDHAKSFGRMMDRPRERGWARSEIVQIKCWAMDPNLGMIATDVTRVKSDGSVLENVRACYYVRRENGA